MIRLYDKASDAELGVLNAAQLEFLIDLLEEESGRDQDYYLDHATLDWLEERGGDEVLMGMLRKALGSRESMEVRWHRNDED